MSDIYSQLTEHFPREVERQLKKGGASLTYIPVSEVITRLNKVFGVTKWSFEIISCGRDALDPDYIVAHVRITSYLDDALGFITRDGFGGQKIKRTKTGDIVDLGDEMKGAVSDALKKAAQTFGVGLYLARTEEAMEAVESVPEPVISPEVEEMWTNFIGLSKSLTADQKTRLNTFWGKYANGRPKPTKSTATVEDLTALIEHCVVLAFDADARKEESDS
jgi:recombination DNA repair RAD52 pathway protein